ncbi:MAG: four helix bundle protein [Acidobacteria bacterium]|nr:four helix bundle protein [Acidobacteriota bacterium]
MSRDHRKLKVFQEADRLLAPTYLETKGFPTEERFGLQSQIRRAAISVATNLVEGCARHTESEFRHFVSISLGSASELAYLLEVASRLGYLDGSSELHRDWTNLVPALKGLHSSLKGPKPLSPHAEPRTKD